MVAFSINTAALEQSIFNQINNYRVSQGLLALTRNPAIDNQAIIHSQNMANGTVSLGHTGFSERIKAIGISYTGAGENVAFNQGHNDPAKIAVQGWLNSPGHLANIKGNYDQTGIGVSSNSKGEIYFTQIFLR
ncbi:MULTISPECIES: CAP domain-containing protein [unclassified Nostoc]|uniref:CAP domain-containing protein n=1 Tax=unclassified Nostoc TaxID=2593658 RepID=UPI002AD49878|nr:CAP domain-containing protein [Nostoc sp. DedQUE03]MDZ7974363.1 CAP domain-containing protein [Nostoc sp. DedQUE03]MDZ8047759.1 CAP domain-containing protein [Nostoc sp. DedQUE02]